jgi:EAL domain-containing protein (putative c-di-GMP-specific phosphodiesterase class I)
VPKIPGGLLNTSSYNLMLEDFGAGYARINFLNLKNFPPAIKKNWIRNFIGWRPST